MLNLVPSIEPFLTKGLLPENLPPIFSSDQLWAPFADDGTGYLITKDCVGEQATYNASKRGGQRRLFSIPHPAFIRDQAVFFQKNWEHLSACMEGSTGSVSKPAFSDNGQRYVRITSHRELPRMRLKKFSRFRFCMVTDVSRFFPSLYTHTLPWAINGKKLAKTDHSYQSAAVFGNRLDFIIRQAQSRQTIGIPIGPDSSKIVSEILMASVDKLFFKLGGIRPPVFMRHVDDYWFAGNSHEECEKHLQNIRSALRTHELDINEVKTKVISAKYMFGDSWPHELEQEVKDSLESGRGGRPHDIVATLSKVVDRATADNDEGIIRHIIRKIDEDKLWSKDWDVLEHFLAQCAVQFVHSFDYVARIVAWRIRINQDVDKELWADVANLICSKSASVGQDSEAVWALWLLKELGATIPKRTSELIMTNCGGLVLAALAHYFANGITEQKSLRSKLWETVDEKPISGSLWPLTREMSYLDLSKPLWKKSNCV